MGPALPGQALEGGPNIVLIVIDDLGYGDLGCYRGEALETPNIDRLAKEGLRLTDFHANAPVCSPTRVALLSGQYQQRSGIESAIGFVKDVGMPLSKVTIAELLADAGYTTGVFGKWHVGHVKRFGPNDQGFDISYCSNNSPDYHNHISRAGELDWYRNQKLHKESGYLTDLVEKHANRFIRQNRDGPFFAFVSHIALHFPFQGPKDPPFRARGKEWHGSERTPGNVEPDSKYGPLPPEEYKRAYKDMMEEVDQSIGSLLAMLEELELRRDTLIVVTSDNGAYSWVGSNGPYRGQKTDLFEGGHRVPAIFNWPGRIPADVVSDATAMTMDLAPTFLALAGIEQPERTKFDGIDLSPLLLHSAPLSERQLFWRFNNKSAQAVRDGSWKYMQQDGSTYLFDLAADPGEKINLAQEHPEKVARLRKAFIDWERDVTSN